MAGIWSGLHRAVMSGKALASDRKQTTDVSHKRSGCFTSRAGFFLTVIHTVPALSRSPWQGLTSNSMPDLKVYICSAERQTQICRWFGNHWVFFFLTNKPLWYDEHATYSYKMFFFKSKKKVHLSKNKRLAFPNQVPSDQVLCWKTWIHLHFILELHHVCMTSKAPRCSPSVLVLKNYKLFHSQLLRELNDYYDFFLRSWFVVTIYCI